MSGDVTMLVGAAGLIIFGLLFWLFVHGGAALR